MAEQDTTCLFIAHGLSIAGYISDRIGVVYKGKIVDTLDTYEPEMLEIAGIAVYYTGNGAFCEKCARYCNTRNRRNGY